MRSNVIIVGAPRSGTNMLRDALTSLPGVATWPCDEINLLWKHHNRRIPHDQLHPEHATKQVRDHMWRRFDDIAGRYNASVVVEKTCATSLRVPFTAAVMPEAKYIFIRRDGIDAAASAIQRWDAPFDPGYVARKLRYAPPTDLPVYAGQFFAKRLADIGARRHQNKAERRTVRSWWGPKPVDYRALQARHTLDELAIIQWKRCVDQAQIDLAYLQEPKVYEVVYEDFVSQPDLHLSALLDFLDIPHNGAKRAVKHVNDSSVGKGHVAFDTAEITHLKAIAASTLKSLGYA